MTLQTPSEIEDLIAEQLEEEEEERPSGETPRPLSEEEVKTIIAGEIDQSVSDDSQVAQERAQALNYYFGRPFGNEVEGRSQVVLTDVADTIEWVMPQLVRMFLGGHDVIAYQPRSQEDVEAAQQASDYINMVVLDDEDGFEIVHDWMKCALMEKNGIVKAWWEETYEPVTEIYEGLSEMQLAMMIGDGWEVLSQEQRIEQGIPLWDVEVTKTEPRGRIRVQAIPPEEFLIANRAVVLDDDTPFAAHRCKRTLSELVALGFDPVKVYSLPVGETDSYRTGHVERYNEQEVPGAADRADPASREVMLTECVIRIDEDGDGYSELRKITVAGDGPLVVLDDVKINHQMFYSVTPVPIPHRFFGQSMADLTMNLQLIRSTLLRNMLDNIYLTNNQRIGAIEGECEIDDLLESRPGGVVRLRSKGAVEPIVTPPLGPMAFNMFEALENIRENKTGITRYNQGLDASSLNQTATGISNIMAASQARIELIARVFAETGFKRLAKGLLRLTVENNTKPMIVRLRGKWVEVDPSSWNENMDCKIHVGLGVGQANERIGHLMNILQTQQGLNQAGLGGLMVTPQNVYATLKELTTAMGFTVPELFFTDPGDKTPQPQPDPDLVEALQGAQAEVQRLELETKKLAAEVIDEARQRELREFEIKERSRVETLRIEAQERVGMAQVGAQKEKGNDRKSQSTAD